MQTQVAVPCLWNSFNEFLNGAIISISRNAQVIGIVQVPPAPAPVTQNSYQNTIPALSVKDPVMGLVYLNLTVAQWEAIANTVTPSTPFTYVYTIGSAGHPAGTTITDTARLYNVTLTAVVVQGITLNLSAIGYTPKTNSTITLLSSVSIGNIVQISGFNN